MRKIIITGARGIVGFSILESFKNSNYIIYPIILSNELPYYFPSSFINKAIKCDITNKKELDSLFSKLNPDIIIHLAANNDNNIPSDGSFHLFETNIIGCINILDYCYQNLSKVKLIMTSSTEVLNLKLKLNNKNKEIYKPYEVSKFSSELITQSYIDCYNLPCIILRPGSIYGGGDFNLKRFIPSMIYNYYINNIKPAPLSNDVSRNLLHTDDLVEFINLIIDDDELFYLGKTINLYNQQSTKFSYLVNKFCLFIDNQFYFNSNKSVTINKKNISNWTPSVNIDNGLLKTFNWYKNFYKEI